MLTIIIFYFSTLAHADEPKLIYKEKTEIDFESVEIEGAVKKPHGEIILERGKANFNPLIQLKESFTLEINQSLSEIQ